MLIDSYSKPRLSALDKRDKLDSHDRVVIHQTKVSLNTFVQLLQFWLSDLITTSASRPQSREQLEQFWPEAMILRSPAIGAGRLVNAIRSKVSVLEISSSLEL